jgi:putative flippase GtrA
MQRLAKLPPGRVMWEPSGDYTAFGTTDALMTIPYFANHPTMEGVHYESSLTTPFHFLMAAEVADRPFNPIPGLPYRTFDFSAGTEHMRVFGVRYFVAWSDRARAAAEASGEFRHAADAGHFAIFELRSHGEVEIPRYEPVRLSRGDWVDTNIRWFSDRSNLQVPLVRGGPTSWASVGPNVSALPKRPIQGGARHLRAAVDDGRISFTTDAVGQPHLIKTSYFPNWRTEGAEGPYLASPSLMLVIPTQRHVTLSYGRTSVEWAGLTLTFAALVLLVVPLLRRRIADAGLGRVEAVPGLVRALWLRHRDAVKPLLQYGVVSVAATAVDLGLFSVLVALEAVPLLVATSVSYLIGLIVSYVLNRRFTFAGRGLSSRTDEFVMFSVISLFGLVLNNVAVALVASLFGRQVLLLNAAKVAAAALIWLVKFAAYRRWVFPERNDEVNQAGLPRPCAPG